jgi:hypothetical protein
VNALSEKERAALVDTHTHVAREVVEHAMAAGEVGEVSEEKLLGTATRALERAATTWEDRASFGSFEVWAAFQVRWAILSKYVPEDRQFRKIDREIYREACKRFGRRVVPPPYVADPERTRLALYGELDEIAAGMAGRTTRVAEDPEASVVDQEEAAHTASMFEKALSEFTADEREWLSVRYISSRENDEESVKAYAEERGLDYRRLLATIDKLEERFRKALKRHGIEEMRKVDAALLRAPMPAPSNDQRGAKSRGGRKKR